MHIGVNLKVVCEDIKYAPTYATEVDSCMELKVKIEDVGKKFIEPNETLTFGTGLQVSIPEDHVMLIFPRSSTGFKLNCMLANTTGVIDSGYRDEIKIALHNYGENPVLIEDGQRIAQFIVIPRPKISLEFVKDDINFRHNDRKGGIGSTGK